MNTQHNKYRPSLSGLMNLSEMNYMLVLRLLANKEFVGDVREFFISECLFYTLEVLEVTRYTSLVHITQHNMDKQSVSNTKKMKQNRHSSKILADILQPVMKLRLYHDARMVEVISSQHISNIKPRYDYPNDNMHQPDEKQQILLFLKEWLQLCLQQGQVSVNIEMDSK